MNLSHLSIDELLFDRQEAHNDLAALAIAKLQGVDNYSGGTVDHRIEGNLAAIEMIRVECMNRSFDPAMYDDVKRMQSNEEIP